MASQTIETKPTYCKVCMVHCGLEADIQGQQVIKVRGDRNHPLTKGYTCPKGRAIDKLHHSPDTVTQPMMRINGQLQPVTWD